MIETFVCLALTKSLIYDKITYYSRELGAYESMVDYIVRNESQYNNCAIGDAHITGSSTPSLGNVQINMKHNPDVAPQQAFNPDFAIPYLINDLRAGKCSKWTTCRNFRKLYPEHPYFKT